MQGVLPNGVFELTNILWDYMQLKQDIRQADAIVVFGNHDILTARRGIELFQQGLAPVLLFSGGLGRVTEGIWQETEAQTFANIAIESGVPEQRIITETKSKNTAENILYTKQELLDRQIAARSVIVVHKPYMERRLYAAFPIYWPEIRMMVTSIKLSLADYLQALIQQGYPANHTVEMVVGDFQRIDVYARDGFQIPQEIPSCAWNAYKELLRLGYTRYVLREEN